MILVLCISWLALVRSGSLLMHTEERERERARNWSYISRAWCLQVEGVGQNLINLSALMAMGEEAILSFSFLHCGPPIFRFCGHTSCRKNSHSAPQLGRVGLLLVYVMSLCTLEVSLLLHLMPSALGAH